MSQTNLTLRVLEGVASQATKLGQCVRISPAWGREERYTDEIRPLEKEIKFAC